MFPKHGPTLKLEGPQPPRIGTSPTDNVISRQLCGSQRLRHASSCYGIDKTGGIAKQHRTAGNARTGVSTQGRRANHGGYLLRAIQSRS
jgi:hypothetical protein